MSLKVTLNGTEIIVSMIVMDGVDMCVFAGHR